MAIRRPSPAELERRRAFAANKLADSTKRVNDAVTAMTTGRQWSYFLDFAARFRHFSFNNVLLIQQQRPDATYVTTYDTWTTLGRQVRRGETGISVIAGDVIHGNDAEGAATTRILQPRNATVFDVSQVDPLTPGPLPAVLAPPVLAGPRAAADLRAHLQQQLLDRGYTTVQPPHPAGDQPVTALDHQRKIVAVRGDSIELDIVAALAGELARVVLHHARPDDPPLLQAVWQVEAASAAWIVLTAQGIDTRRLRPLPRPPDWAAPIAGADVDAYVSVVRGVGNHAIFAARTILDRIEPAPTGTVEQVRQLETQVQQTAAIAADVPPVSRHAHQSTYRPARTPAGTGPRPEAIQRLAPVTAATLAYFTDFDRAEIARQYLAGRGITLPDGYIAGYAPVGGGLVDWLKSHGFDEHLQLVAGVVRIGKDGRVVDVFRDRIVFPIYDGPTLAGFTGRAARDSEIKYLNTPAVELFEKGRLLYGLAERQQRLRDGATPVLVEGPIDALAVAQYPSRLVPIAAMGTAFTDRHARTLSATVPDKRIIIALDDDRAGRDAAVAAGEKLAAAGWQIRVPQPAGGLDPADLAAQHGQKVIDWLDPQRCRPLIYLAAEQHIAEHGPLEWAETRLMAARSTWAYLKTRFSLDPNLQHAIDYAADRCGITRPEPDESPPSAAANPQTPGPPPTQTAAVMQSTRAITPADLYGGTHRH